MNTKKENLLKTDVGLIPTLILGGMIIAAITQSLWPAMIGLALGGFIGVYQSRTNESV